MKKGKKKKINNKKYSSIVIIGISLIIIIGLLLMGNFFSHGSNSYFARIRVAIKKKVQIVYNQNLFAANSFENKTITEYNEEKQTLTFDGKLDGSFIELGLLGNIKLKKGERYRLTISNVSGSYSSTSGKGPVFIFEFKKNGEYYTDRKNGIHYIYDTLPEKKDTPIDKVITIKDEVTDANNLVYRLYQKTSEDTTFNKYKIQVSVTKLESKIGVAGEKYGELPTPEKDGYEFLGWYDSLSSGKKVVETNTILKKYNHPLYAHWKEDKIYLNKTDITLASWTSEKLSVRSSSATSGLEWISDNPIIANVNKDGVVRGVKPGETTITAKIGSRTAKCKVKVTSKNEEVASYDSSTLKYWTERPASNHVVTHIWVKDAYNQMKVAISSPQSADKEYPRYLEQPEAMIKKEITNKKYENKGLIAVNASGMIKNANNFCPNCPKEWYGTSIIPLQINEGKIIRDSTRTSDVEIVMKKFVYMLGKDGYLTYVKYSKDITSNIAITENVLNNIKPKYTFGFGPLLVIDGKVQDKLSADKNMRQAICQIDKNNFVLITTTVGKGNRPGGLSIKELGDMMYGFGCQTAYNLDGGGSTAYLYKYNKNNISKVYTGYDGRGSSDMVYFVEK